MGASPLESGVAGHAAAVGARDPEAMRAEGPCEARHMRVASYNVHRCIGSDLQRNVARVAAVIRELECDTVGLQEVDSVAGGGGDAMQLDFLAAATGMQAVPGLTLVRHDGHYGNALLTHRRIIAVRRHDLSFSRREPRSALEVELEASPLPLRVIVTHLGLRAGERRYQVRRMLELVRAVPAEQTVVVLGDINEWLPTARPLRWLHGLLGKPPAQRSFPVWLPVFALDRVWVRPRDALLTLRAHRSAMARRASDHFPVKAVVAIRAS
jgi:endonuclease/exonuclease/phosphatase family metal-dependent hydrolase